MGNHLKLCHVLIVFVDPVWLIHNPYASHQHCESAQGDVTHLCVGSYIHITFCVKNLTFLGII